MHDQVVSANSRIPKDSALLVRSRDRDSKRSHQHDR